MLGPGPQVNLARQFLESNGETTGDYDGNCGGLCDLVISADDDIIYVEGWLPNDWTFHMVPLIKGLIHDAWCPGDALPLDEWLKKMFGDRAVEVSFNGDTFYHGRADKLEIHTCRELY